MKDLIEQKIQEYLDTYDCSDEFYDHRRDNTVISRVAERLINIIEEDFEKLFDNVLEDFIAEEIFTANQERRDEYDED